MRAQISEQNTRMARVIPHFGCNEPRPKDKDSHAETAVGMEATEDAGGGVDPAFIGDPGSVNRPQQGDSHAGREMGGQSNWATKIRGKQRHNA